MDRLGRLADGKTGHIPHRTVEEIPVFLSRYMPCPDCGESVARRAPMAHECDPGRRADFMMFGLRDEIRAFDAMFEEYVLSPVGRFEAWLAARDVRRTV